MRYRPTDQQTDRPTDTAYYRDARTHLKSLEINAARGAWQNKEGFSVAWSEGRSVMRKLMRQECMRGMDET